MINIVTIYRLSWNNKKENGLWDNGHRVSIHLPRFTESFLNGKSFKQEYVNDFYIYYGDDEEDEEMRFSYFGINDIVFNNSVYKYGDKAEVWTSIKPWPVI